MNIPWYRLRQPDGRLFAAVGLLAALCAFIWTTVVIEMPPKYLTFAVLNVGQGDALFIESPSGEQVLIDGGPDDTVLADLPEVMPFFDRSLDAVIATHPDADHITGLIDVLKDYRVGAFIEPGIEKYDATNDALEGEVASEKIPHYIARAGMALDLGDGAKLDILYPDRDVAHLRAGADNDGGIVAWLTYGKTSVLLTADVDASVENHLLAEYGSALKSTILKVAHHGSKNSDDAAFDADVNPEWAVISVGAGNSYGHPSPQTLETLASEHIPVLRTDTDGQLVFQSNGSRMWREPQEAPFYDL